MKKAFTLSEILITISIIGIVAALTIPSIVSNYQQNEYKTGLRKAIAVIDTAISISITENGDSPYQNKNLFKYLQKHMKILKTFSAETREKCMEDEAFDIMGSAYAAPMPSNCMEPKFITRNAGFYTLDGMRFEFAGYESTRMGKVFNLYENSRISACSTTVSQDYFDSDGMWIESNSEYLCGGCGSYGLKINPRQTKKPPCVITVDVNGDNKPNYLGAENKFYAEGRSGRLTDVFSIMITESKAVPYGTAAQKAMYNKKK